MSKIALCDDREEDRAALGAMLREYAGRRPGLSISFFSSGEQLLLAEDGIDFDLYVLDVIMPDMSGIQLGARLRKLGCRGAIIYLSVSPDFAVDSYDTRAFHYLLKPIQTARFFEVLDQALEATERGKAACIKVKTRNNTRLIWLDEIMYVELVEHTACYHLAGGEAINSVTLRRSFRNELEALLQYPEFVLCGASFAANLRYVTEIHKSTLCLQGTLPGCIRIPMPRGTAVGLRQQWENYWLRSLDGSE